MMKPSQNITQNPSEAYLHAELTKQIIGAGFDVFKVLGYGLQEKYYQRALAEQLTSLQIPFIREQVQPIYFNEKIIGRYFMDFVVDQSVVVEMKVGNEFYQSHIRQVVGYLKTTGIPIGLILRIEPGGMRVKRVIYTS